ncbi:MAG: DUF898 family protein [Gammaproteobacteria bacterium]|nr:DUF898 family protein [Gammaproteobacteria bacterium]
MENKNFSFTGKGGEYFKIWIVNILLTIITLGIYSAWATVRNKRYIYGNSWFNDSNFEYHATGKQILLGRLIAIVMLLIYVALSAILPGSELVLLFLLFLAMPWLMLRSLQFNARMSSYRNVRFSFQASIKDAYKYLLFIPVLPFLIAAPVLGVMVLLDAFSIEIFSILLGLSFAAVFFMLPYVGMLVTRFSFNNHYYGQGKFSAQLRAGEYYMAYLKTFGLAILTTLALSIVSGIVVAAIMFLSGAGDNLQGDIMSSSEDMLVYMIPGIIVFYLFMIILGAFLKAYLTSKIRNYSLNQIHLDDVLHLSSTIETSSLFKLYLVNALLIIFTLGLASPWVVIRQMNYTFARTHAQVSGDLDQYITQQLNNRTSIGDEVGDAFDMQGALEVGI